MSEDNVCAATQSFTVVASHSAARGWLHGAFTSICVAMLSMRICSRAASSRMLGSGGTVPVYVERRPSLM